MIKSITRDHLISSGGGWKKFARKYLLCQEIEQVSADTYLLLAASDDSRQACLNVAFFYNLPGDRIQCLQHGTGAYPEKP